MATNDFIGFASNGSANVMSQADYAAASEQGVGVQPGMASSALANKIWRQGANMAAALGTITAARGYNAQDDGDIATLATNVTNALSLNKDYVLVSSETISVNANTDTDILTYTFTKTGIYIANYSLNFRFQGGTGIRQLVVSNQSTGSSIDQSAVFNSNPTSSGYTFLNLLRIEKITAANTKRYLVAKQTTSAAMNITGQITVARLGDA